MREQDIEDAKIIEEEDDGIEKKSMPDKKEVTLKKQLKNHVQVVSEVIGYSVLSRDKAGFHSMATTYPDELTNLIYLYHSRAISKHEGDIIKAIVNAGLERIKVAEKAEKEKLEKLAKENHGSLSVDK